MSWCLVQATGRREDGPPRKRSKIGFGEGEKSEEEWSAALYKTMPVSLPDQLRSDPANKQELKDLLQSFFPEDEISMEPESRRIGNRGGHDLIELAQDLLKQVGELKEKQNQFDEGLKEAEKKIGEQQKIIGEQEERIGEQEERIGEQQERIGEQQKRIGENDYLLLAAYANELEWTAGKSDGQSRYTRNVIIHGGNVRYAVRSIDLLEELGEMSRVANASEGFEITYGVPIGMIRSIIATAPEEIVDMLNRRAVLKKLWKWKEKFPEETRLWIENSDHAIKTWLQSGGGLEDSFKKEYLGLCQWMAGRIEAIKGYSQLGSGCT